MDKGLRKVAPQLPLGHVVFLGIQTGRAAGRPVALEPVRRPGALPACLRDLGQPESAEQEGTLGLVQRPGVVAEPVHVPVLR